jgi:hypothetical protein
MAYYWLTWFGGAAYVAPVLILLVGLGCYFDAFAYLRRRWGWALLLLLCCVGLLDLYRKSLGALEAHFGITAGGILGVNLNRYLFGYFGTVGATILFATLYFVSLLFLTNFQLGSWLRAIWALRPGTPGPLPPEEQELEKRAEVLREQSRKLQEEMKRSGLGQDLRPVPEPNVVDLSVPQAKPGAGRPKKASPAPEEPRLVQPADEGEVIPAREVAAASTADVLGKKSEPGPAPAASDPRRGLPLKKATATKRLRRRPPLAPRLPLLLHRCRQHHHLQSRN